MKCYVFSVGFLVCICCSIYKLKAQAATETVTSNQPDLSSMVSEGNSLLQKGEFGKAQKIWDEVVVKMPENSNAHFKLGLCYRNIAEEQTKSLSHFQKAVKNTTSNYNFSGKSDQAPVDAWFFLAEAFFMRNQPDSALTYFTQYQAKYNGNPPIDVNRQISMCINAKNSVLSPRDVSFKNIGRNINSENSETDPVVSIDNTTMFFASARPAEIAETKIDPISGKPHTDIYVTINEDGNWRTAQPFKYNTPGNEEPLFLATDGTLYLKRQEKGVYNIYRSKFENGTWNEPVSMK
jgi:tetratricopeptide (TPR) repeat protein